MKEFQHKDPTRSGIDSRRILSPSIISGGISLNDWCDIVSHVLQLQLPWRTLKARLVDLDSQGNVIYESTFRSQELQCSFNSKLTSVRKGTSPFALERLFPLFSAAIVSAKRSIETKIYWKQSFERLIKITQVGSILFRISLPCSFDALAGLISMQEFADVCIFLSKHNASKLDEKQIMDLAASIDLDKNGVIDFNEFLEAFRMVDVNEHF
jgi:serine/threonine-protein phosphatase with EF-hands